MPYMDQHCRVCGEFVKSNNLKRHVKRWHPDLNGDAVIPSRNRTPSTDRDESIERQSRRSSTKSAQFLSTPVSADYIKDAVLCMLRRVDGVNVPSMSSYLETHFPDIPKMWQMPIIVSAFTAVQKAAATHGDTILDTSDERAIWAKRSLA